jgi:hypothetical protein
MMPSSGQISLSTVNTELGTVGATCSLGETRTYLVFCSKRSDKFK